MAYAALLALLSTPVEPNRVVRPSLAWVTLEPASLEAVMDPSASAAAPEAPVSPFGPWRPWRPCDPATPCGPAKPRAPVAPRSDVSTLGSSLRWVIARFLTCLVPTLLAGTLIAA